jgi:hypothetical protein
MKHGGGSSDAPSLEQHARQIGGVTKTRVSRPAASAEGSRQSYGRVSAACGIRSNFLQATWTRK